MLGVQLSDIGYKEVVLFENGNECLEHLYLKPRIIFLDYELGEENGLHYLKEIKKYDEQIEVVFCTAHENLTIALDALKFGSLDYLLKTNVNANELKRILG